MDYKKIFNEVLPAATFISAEQPNEWIDLLYRNNWLDKSDQITSIEKAGEGNMNLVLRIKTTSKSIILKQSRPWVEKYPTLEAPANRIQAEAAFYQEVTAHQYFQKFCPQIFAFDALTYLLVMEDLGAGTDYTSLYKKNNLLSDEELKVLMEFLTNLHNLTTPTYFPTNKELKKLNHTHIFKYPFQKSNGFDLDLIESGLQKLASYYQGNSILQTRLDELGAHYLAEGKILIHGDYYPGSWLKTVSGIKVIDPEFSHLGYAEFDFGVAVAHLHLAQVGDEKIKLAMHLYKKPDQFDENLFRGFCGAEIMRRLIGLAQLPLELKLSEKEVLMEYANELILK